MAVLGFVRNEPGKAGMFSVELYGRVRHACHVEGWTCREFRVRAGMMGAKEPRHAATQRAEDPRRRPRPAAGRRRPEGGVRSGWPARRAEEGPGRTGAERRDGPPPRRRRWRR